VSIWKLWITRFVLHRLTLQALKELCPVYTPEQESVKKKKRKREKEKERRDNE
jgi:hypothetical protein